MKTHMEILIDILDRIKRRGANVAVRNPRTSRGKTRNIRHKTMTLSLSISRNGNILGRGRLYWMMKNSRSRKIDVSLRAVSNKALGILAPCSSPTERVTS